MGWIRASLGLSQSRLGTLNLLTGVAMLNRNVDVDIDVEDDPTPSTTQSPSLRLRANQSSFLRVLSWS